jgi:hypothetical protein
MLNPFQSQLRLHMQHLHQLLQHQLLQDQQQLQSLHFVERQ